MPYNHYILEDRLYGYLYHWIIYILGGLRRIPDTEEKPVKVYLPITTPQRYHQECLDMISDQYVNVVPTEDAIKINHHGEPLICADHVHPDTYHFLRNLFLSRMPPMELDSKQRIYITRRNCGVLNPANGGRTIRDILNEEEIHPILKEFGFKVLQFEELSFQDKIRTFATSSIVISPNSGSLTFSLFADKNTRIVEILPEVIEWHDHYKNICNHIGIPYDRFTNVTTVGRPVIGGPIWNMIIDANAFRSYLQRICG